ncbi:MAG: ABC transporter permease [Aristaeellaceae bacterium]
MNHMWTSLRLTVTNGVKYLPLLKNLIARELKKKYRNTVLGYAWCVLNPLLVMLIMTAVFSNMFRKDIANFPVYLFCGRMIYSFATGGAGNILRSIRGNSSLMRKTRIPYYVFPLSSFCSAMVDFLFTLIAFALVLLFTRTPLSIHVVAFPLVVLETAVFTFGLGMLLAVCNVYIKDVSYLYSVFTVAWMYLTPMFYPLEALSEPMQHLISTYNPLYYYISQMRAIFLDHAWPDGRMVLLGCAAGAVLLVASLLSYNKAKNTLILYV